ncbi:MAG TPA: hypothetical protein VMZ53_24915 [Kofleriaceae bacterium]|nr:hypothetical protein [Kofleriaceae bacterium]
MKSLVVFTLVMLTAGRAHAGGAAFPNPGTANVLAGPTVGIAWGHGHTRHFSLGFEAGVGYMVERANVGIVRRADESLVYITLDPWLFVGATLGAGYGTESGFTPILGVWEGAPLGLQCEGRSSGDWATQGTISISYRWSGVHEILFSPKFGKERC